MPEEDYYLVEVKAEIDELISTIDSLPLIDVGEHSQFVIDTLQELKARAEALKRDLSPHDGVVEI